MSLTYEKTSLSVRREIISMVFGDTNEDQEEILKLFTNSKLRSRLPNKKVVWKRGVARYPEINHFTGAVTLYNNFLVWKLALNTKIISALTTKYSKNGVDNTLELGMYQGPPTLLVKPSGSGVSSPFMYMFGKYSDQIKYTGLLCISQNVKVNSGGVELLQCFEEYYNILNLFYDFESHSKGKDILYLENKWFNLDEANRIIEDYTSLYNYYIRGISCTLERTIPVEIALLYEKHKFEVKEIYTPMTWETVSSHEGSLHIFSSRQVLRTSSSRDNSARIYIQISIEPKPIGWDSSQDKLDMIESYKTGKFGNWSKPGLRRYLRENSTEYNWRLSTEPKEEKEKKLQFVKQHASFLGVT